MKYRGTEHLTELQRKERNERIQALQPEGPTPFIFIPVNCPVCATESVQRYFKSDAYTVMERDLDFRPLEYIWGDPRFSKNFPSLYYLWRCPRCFFTASQQYFENPVTDVVGSLSHFRKSILTNFKDNENFLSIVEVLSDSKEGELVFYKAIKNFLMALLFYGSIPSILERDSLPLARFCIHLAWLYKEVEVSEQRVSTKILLDQLKYSIIHFWPDVPLDYSSSIALSKKYYEQCYYNSPIPESKKIEYQILQLVGRLEILLGNIECGRNLILSSITIANKYRADLERHMKRDGLSGPEFDDATVKMNKFDSFVQESQDILFSAKQQLKSKKDS